MEEISNEILCREILIINTKIDCLITLFERLENKVISMSPISTSLDRYREAMKSTKNDYDKLRDDIKQYETTSRDRVDEFLEKEKNGEL